MSSTYSHCRFLSLEKTFSGSCVIALLLRFLELKICEADCIEDFTLIKLKNAKKDCGQCLGFAVVTLTWSLKTAGHIVFLGVGFLGY